MRINTMVLGMAVLSVTQSRAQEGRPAAWGVSGGVTFIDGSLFSGIEPRGTPRVHYLVDRAGGVGLDASLAGTIGTTLDADIGFLLDIGGRYLLTNRRFGFTLGPSLLTPLGGGDTDLLPGLFAAIQILTDWGLFVDLRQHVYFKSGNVLRYPSVGVGWRAVP